MQSNSPTHRRSRWFLVVAVITGAGAGTGYFCFRGRAAAEISQPAQATSAKAESAVPVKVVTPRPGGIDRLCRQPGSVEPFEAADLYSKVSGYLAEQSVDIGYPVRAGQILARISVPEYEKQVQEDTANVARVEARVEQMRAAITTAEADLGATAAEISLAIAEEKSKASFRAYREKQRDRIKDLVSTNSIEAKLADENEDQYQAAVASDLAAAQSIVAARQKEAAARARVAQARADLRYAEAEVATAKSRLEKSKVMLDYTIIRSPYTGVVTQRNFNPGDFIRSADAGYAKGERVPVLSVERTDLMRVVVQVPERDVPFVDCGDPAEVEVDALPGVVFKTRGSDKVVVSRLAASEDPQTRMMRTEVHVKNPDGKLRRGMFGRVTLILQVGAPGEFRIPSAALCGKADGGNAVVRVARAGKCAVVPVRIGSDSGSEVEVRSGLTADDRVIVQASAPISEGTAVAANE
jgi:RND family efflux transporter MFP subunit